MAQQLDHNQCKGEYAENYALARHTSWRIGGPAERFYRPTDLDDLCHFLRTLPADEPLMWIGLGSNLLIRDGGIAGTVIVTQGRLKQLTQESELIVRAEAGASCATVARFCARLGLAGVEFLAGIPGTIGGALAMNAGAFGGETWDWVEEVEIVDRSGTLHRRSPTDYQIAYREVIGKKNEWFVAGYFRCHLGDKTESLEKIKSFIQRRTDTQPANEPSCGSVFRNPPQDYAARLIETCGLKGYRIGGACVSEKHANFILNKGGATADEVEALIQHVAQQVKQKHGVDLVREVKMVGQHKS